MARPLCLYFLLCRINTAIPPSSQGCPDKEVRQLMSSAGKSAREPGSKCSHGCVTQSSPAHEGPAGVLARPSTLGWAWSGSYASRRSERLSLSTPTAAQGLARLGSGLLGLPSVLENTVHLAASLPSTMDTICVLYMRKPRKVTLKSHPEASHLVFFVHLDLSSPFVNTAVSQSTWLFLRLHVCS